MMPKALEKGIASEQGDCIENVALLPMQVKVSMQQNQYEGNKLFSPPNNNSKLDLNPKSLCVDKNSQGDQPLKYPENACLCCKRQFERPKESIKPTRMMYWEIPRPKFGGISVTADDYRAHKLPKREVPTWHPHRSQPWTWLKVPSVTETTYRKDFAPPSLANKVRKLPLRPSIISTQGSPNGTGKSP